VAATGVFAAAGTTLAGAGACETVAAGPDIETGAACEPAAEVCCPECCAAALAVFALSPFDPEESSAPWRDDCLSFRLAAGSSFVWRVVERASGAGRFEFEGALGRWTLPGVALEGAVAATAFTGSALTGAAFAEAELVDAAFMGAPFVEAAFTGEAIAEGVFVDDAASTDVLNAPCWPFILMRTSTAACGVTGNRSGWLAGPAEAVCGLLAFVPVEPGVVTGRSTGTVTTGTDTAAGVAADGDSDLGSSAAGIARLARIGDGTVFSAFWAACAVSESVAGVASDTSKSATELPCRRGGKMLAEVAVARFVVAAGAGAGAVWTGAAGATIAPVPSPG